MAGSLVFHIAGTGPVAANLAKVVEQGDDGDRFRLVFQAVQLLHPGAGQVIGQAVVDVDAVVAQAARVSAVVTGGGRGGEKVAFVL